MTTHPYIFPQEQIQAILDGSKTQFRVPLAMQPPKWAELIKHDDSRFVFGHSSTSDYHCAHTPYEIGDWLIVNEIRGMYFSITGIKVMRIQDISEEDCLKNYVGNWGCDTIEVFKDYFDSTHGECAWDRNDWVWVFEFKRIK